MGLVLLVMLALSRVMVHAGMIATLADVATGIGPAWPLVAPLIGLLGTGSSTASNILFMEFQVSTARGLNLPLPAMAAAQGFGAAIGNVVAPHNIIAGSATVGLVGREGDVQALTIRAALTYAVAGVIAAFAVLLAA